MMAREPTKGKRSNYWISIVYPESSPNDWQRRLESLHIQAIISPLHSPDPDPETLYEKKEHYHVMFMYDSLKSYGQAIEDFEDVFENGFTRYMLIPRSKVGQLKYFCHLKNPGKEKLDPADVITFGGVDYLEEISDEGGALYITLGEITEFIHNNHIKSFIKFALWCQYNNLEWSRILSSRSTLYIKAIIDSERNWNRDNLEEGKVD